MAASWCKRPDKRSPNQTTATLKVACANPDVANCLLTGHIRVDDHLVTVRKDLRIPIRCVKCQEYGHIQDACIGIEKCANCASESHHSDKCNRPPLLHFLWPWLQSPKHFGIMPNKCEALDSRFPENTMPYFPAKEDWTWAALPSNLPPPLESPPSFQYPNANSRSLSPQRQNPRRKEVRFETPETPPQSQPQEHQPENGWTSVRRRRSSPQRHQQTTILDIWGPQHNTPQPASATQHANTPAQPSTQ